MFGKKTQKIDRGKIREERFRRIASRRVQVILDKLRLLGNCSDKSNYSYEEGQVRKTFRAIEEETKRVKALFNKPKKKSKFEL